MPFNVCSTPSALLLYPLRRLVRRLEFDRPILEVTREMATKDAADRAAAAVAAAAATAAAAVAAEAAEREQQQPLMAAPAPSEQQDHCIVTISGAEGVIETPPSAQDDAGAHSSVQRDDGSHVPLLQSSAAEVEQRSVER